MRAPRRDGNEQKEGGGIQAQREIWREAQEIQMIPTDVKNAIDEIVAEASFVASDRANARKALELAWADDREFSRKSHILEDWDSNTFYDATMTLQTNGTKQRWKVELRVTRAK